MFKKLLSNLPFNPSLIGQIGFYSHRVHQETAVRRASIVIMSLALVLQVFAVASPPEPTLAQSNNDMITGGITSRERAVTACRQNSRDYRTILAYYGISCDSLAQTSTVTIKSTDHNKRLYSMGHLAYGKAGETPVKIPGVTGTMYLRYLWSWDSGAYSTYKALKGTTSTGATYYIIYDCGNLTFIGLPKPVAPKDVCTNIPGNQTKPEECDVCPNVSGVQTKESECDVCPKTPGIQTKTSQCDLCPNLAGVQTTAQCDVCPNKSGVQSNQEECDVCPTTVGIQLKSDECDVCPNVNGVQTKAADCDVCPELDGVQTDASQCRSCTSSQTRDDLSACLEYRKSVANPTQGLGDANGTTAKAGDTLVYTLTATNKGKIDIKDYSVSENISDVLDYANLINANGGTKNDDHIISWPGATIKAGQSLTKTFTVKVKDPIPSTPVSASDPGHFDMAMTNVYGNTVTVKLPPTVVKAAEITVGKLPSTGPGTSLAIAFTITVFAGYFFARSRLVAKELDIVRADFGSTGGI